MDITAIIFILIAIYTFFCIVMTIRSEKVMQSTYWLILMLVGVSLIYLLGNSEILFVFQLSIYSGGIAVLLLFAAVLTEHEELGFDNSLIGIIKNTKYQLFVYGLFAVNMVALIMKSILDDTYPILSDLGDTTRTYTQAFDQMYGFSLYLWTDLSEVILILGLLVLTAILGSVKLVIREEEIEDLSEEVLLRLKGNAKEVSL